MDDDIAENVVWERDQARSRVQGLELDLDRLQRRIRKARELLEDAHYADDARDQASLIVRALDALEGK